MVIGVSCAVRLVAMRRHAVDPRADQDGEQEAGQRQRRDERDEGFDRHRLIP
jgi:heme-degrading monooxygenase HmoA